MGQSDTLNIACFFSVGVILSSSGTQSKNKAHREDVFWFGLL